MKRKQKKGIISFRACTGVSEMSDILDPDQTRLKSGLILV